MSLSTLPNDVLGVIAEQMAQINLFRDKYSVMKDAMACFTAGKTLHAFAHMILEKVAQNKLNKVAFGWDSKYKEIIQGGTARELRALCNRLQVSSSGTKNILIKRLEKLYLQKYKVISDQATIQKLETYRYKTTSLVSAKSVFGLTKQDLNVLETDSNSYYKLCEVREVAIKKHKTVDELQSYLACQAETCKMRHEQRTQRLLSRQNELQDFIRQINGDISMIQLPMCDAYIKKSDGLLGEIKTKLEEINFLKTYTQYDVWIEEIGEIESNIGNYDVSKYPLELHEYCKRMALKGWMRQFANKEEALACAYLPKSLHYSILMIV
jgi:hypothetical protein